MQASSSRGVSECISGTWSGIRELGLGGRHDWVDGSPGTRSKQGCRLEQPITASSVDDEIHGRIAVIGKRATPLDLRGTLRAGAASQQ